MKVLKDSKPDLLHVQNDAEVFRLSELRDDVMGLGIKLFTPTHNVVATCVNKWDSYLAFKAAGITVPENMLVNSRDKLKRAFSELGDHEGRIWLRYAGIGGGGAGSIPTNDFDMARCWIDRFDGWGSFVAAQMLTQRTVTWLSIWWEGEFVVAQTRKRTGWIHGNRSVSGVTGVTKVGTTCSDELVTAIAISAVKAVDEKQHGIFGVDLAYDKSGIPNPTEINISRFFTAILFFTRAGLNMPVIFKDLALYGEKPELDCPVNPLPDGLMWLRGMDTEPVLVTAEEMEAWLIRL